ncbi:ornithine decarboxylase [Trifolium medium]|uniref:Ornithine decarboxylase n=1 Tax=Trifolium medium TaxID=97028 RepID=A0A392MM10_9FABA|nr:ornithine decarboxylase [Trifolium medium]
MPTLVAEEPQIITNLKPFFGTSGVKGKKVATLSSQGTISDFIQTIIKDSPTEIDSPFSVIDLRVLIDLMNKWTTNLPTVKAFNAVKCNPNISIIGALAALGTNFNCASRAEIESILSLGVSPDRIIYANACKPESHIKYVDKIRKWHPKCEMILRIKPEEESRA